MPGDIEKKATTSKRKGSYISCKILISLGKMALIWVRG
jgi:hypothetical protein